jgi:SMI1-KNR4 cell-wall/Ankyrin repeats (3 copies)
MSQQLRELLVQQFPILKLLEDSHDPPLTSEVIEELEVLLGVRFPKDYADFLMAFNGGHFGRNVDFCLPEPKPFLSGALMMRFYGEPNDGIETYGLIRHADVLSDRLPEDVLAIADCNSQDHVVLRYADAKTTFAGVWFWDSAAFWDDEPPLHWLADTFNDFLALLVYDVTSYEGEPEALPLFQAIQDGGFRTIERYLADGGEVEARNAAGWTLLMAAIIHSWPRIAKILLDYGADSNARDNKGQTPLHHAACHSVDCVKLLLAAGADATARDNEGKGVLAEWSYRADQILRAHGAEE